MLYVSNNNIDNHASLNKIFVEDDCGQFLMDIGGGSEVKDHNYTCFYGVRHNYKTLIFLLTGRFSIAICNLFGRKICLKKN